MTALRTTVLRTTVLRTTALLRRLYIKALRRASCRASCRALCEASVRRASCRASCRASIELRAEPPYAELRAEKKLKYGTFILIDCDILCIFYWIKDILCSLIRIIQNHPDSYH